VQINRSGFYRREGQPGQGRTGQDRRDLLALFTERENVAVSLCGFAEDPMDRSNILQLESKSQTIDKSTL
jgi:hypothetical protein